MRRLLVIVLMGLALVGCQVADDPIDGSAPDAPGPTEQQALGSPDPDWPATLPQLLAYTAPEALAWQDDPVVVDLTVWLDPDGAWTQVRVTYVAADATRMLTVRATPQDLRTERPLLGGLQLPELPAAATDAIAAFPPEALEPVALAEAAARALADCGASADAVEALLYATGAPAAWDGSAWTRNPTWRATVLTADVGVVVDPTSGQAFAPLTCVEPLLLDG